MRSGSVFILFCGLFLLAYGSEKDVGNANDYVDEVLKNLRDEDSLTSNFDPLDIPEAYGSNYEIKGGKVRGLSSLYRHGDCTLRYDGEIVHVSAEVAVRDVVVDNLAYGVKALFFWIKGHVTVTVDGLAVKMDISGKGKKAKLESLKVIHLGSYRIKKITGLSVVLNWLLKLIANSIAQQSRGKIVNALETAVANAVGDLLDKHELPDLSG